MTKKEMLMEMLEMVNLPNDEQALKNRMGKPKRVIEEAYNLFKMNPTKDEARFYLMILIKW